MSVQIKGMKIPETCKLCPLSEFDARNYVIACKASRYLIDYQLAKTTRPPMICPLVEVPPHGRLIDADALHKLFEDQWHYLQVLDWNENPTAEARQSGVNSCINTRHDSDPTIIEAEEGE